MHVCAVSVPAFCAPRADRPNRIGGEACVQRAAVWRRPGRSQGAGRRAEVGCAPRSRRRRQRRGAWCSGNTVHRRYRGAHGGPGAVVRDAGRPLRAIAGAGGSPSRPGDLRRGGRGEGSAGLHGGRAPSWRPFRRCRRTGAFANGGLAPLTALCRRKWHACPCYPALATHDRCCGFRAADSKSNTMADFGTALKRPSCSRHRARPMAGRADPCPCGRVRRFRAGSL